MAKRAVVLALAAILGACGGGRALGDVLLKTDGTRLEGRVAAQDDKTVTMEVNYQGLVVRQKIARTEIKSLTQETRQGPGYCVLPLEGDVGVEITADTLSSAIEMARRDGASYVILRINSNGGKVREMADIVNVLAQASKKVQIVAFVEKGFSAAAIIAMACPTIYLAPDARIGAAVPFKMGPSGTPENIEQKFLSTVTAEMRLAAETGHHPSILVRGMSEIGLELVLRTDNGKSTIVEVAAGREEAGDEIIKDPGQIMTLTAREAERYGLSAGTAGKVEELREKLGIKAWFHAGKGAEDYLAQAEKSGAGMAAAHTDTLLGNSMEDCEKKQKELEGQIKDLTTQLSADERGIKADYEKAMGAQHPPSELKKYKDLADADAQQRWTDIHLDYQKKVMALKADLRTVLVEESILKQAQSERQAGN